MLQIDDIVIDDSERQTCEVWSRVMGYYRPVSEFNIGKKVEFRERVNFTFEKANKIVSEDESLNTSETE